MIVVCQLLIVIGITYFNIGMYTNLGGGGGVLLVSFDPIPDIHTQLSNWIHKPITL